jgi:ketosteroid isomerase-like protein
MGEMTSDELALRALVERYFNALDRRDLKTIGECFASDAHASFNAGNVILEGREAIVRDFEFINTFLSSVHALASASVDTARQEGIVFAVAYMQTVQGDGEPRLLVRGIRYDDRYIQEDGQWRFQSREHRALWQYDAECVSPWTRGGA